MGELQEEAVNGGLRACSFETNDEHLDEKLNKLHKEIHEVQMVSCFEVAWASISSVFNENSFHRSFERFFYKWWWVRGEYWLMRRDIEIVLAFVMTLETIMDDLQVLQEFDQEVKKPMLKVAEKAKATALYELHHQDAAMFALIEHIICVSLMVRSQYHVVYELTNEGVLTEHDAEFIVDIAVTPVLDALQSYTPTRHQLQAVAKAALSRQNSKSVFTRICSFRWGRKEEVRKVHPAHVTDDEPLPSAQTGVIVYPPVDTGGDPNPPSAAPPVSSVSNDSGGRDGDASLSGGCGHSAQLAPSGEGQPVSGSGGFRLAW